MKEITLYGAGGHAWAVIELIRSLGDYQPVLILDDQPKGADILGIPVHRPGSEEIKGDVCITIGNNHHRKAIAQRLHFRFPTFVHASAQLYPSVQLGKGVQVLPGAVLDAAVSIGDFVIINNQATVSHNATVGNYSHIAIQAALAGEVNIGEGCLVGAGSVILPGIKVGAWSVIGAGAVVTKDVPPNSVVTGNPARIIKQTTNG